MTDNPMTATEILRRRAEQAPITNARFDEAIAPLRFHLTRVLTSLEYTTDILARMGIDDPAKHGYELSEMGTWRKVAE